MRVRAATVMVPKTAQTVAAVVMLCFMLVGGFYVSNIPVWIAWIKWLAFLTFTFALLTKVGAVCCSALPASNEYETVGSSYP